MAAAIARRQGQDGLWRANLDDPELQDLFPGDLKGAVETRARSIVNIEAQLETINSLRMEL